jgi:hypothetical protein
MRHISVTLRELRRRFPWFKPGVPPIYEDLPELKGVDESVKALQASRDYFNSEPYMRQWDRANWYGSRPEIRRFTYVFLRALRARGIPFYPHTVFRSLEEQAALRDAGFSKVAVGPHQSGSAVDLVHSWRHWNVPREAFLFIGLLGEQVASGMNLGTGMDGRPLKIEWGGRFRSLYDPAHWQLSDWRSRSVLPVEGVELRSPYSEEMKK